jgi:hypothetical protein
MMPYDNTVFLARGDGFSGGRLARLSGADLVVISRGARPEAPLLEGASTLAGCGIEGKEVGEVQIVLDPGTGGTRGVPRVIGFQLHSMAATVIADPRIARSVEAIVRTRARSKLDALGRIQRLRCPGLGTRCVTEVLPEPGVLLEVDEKRGPPVPVMAAGDHHRVTVLTAVALSSLSPAALSLLSVSTIGTMATVC